MKPKAHQLIALLCLLASSCEKVIVPDNESVPSAVETSPEKPDYNSVLSVRTRGVSALDEEGSGGQSAEKEKISYPVRVFAFDSQSRCMGVQDLEDGNSTLQFKLPEGNYKVYAVGLDQADRYAIPEQSDVKPESKLVLKDGMEHGDLMTAAADVALSEDETNILTLQMERKVLKVDDVVMTNIPENVTNVFVTILPLGENLQVNGSVDRNNGAQVIELTKDEATQAWNSTQSYYLLASNSQATVKVSLTYDTGKTLAFSYVSSETLEANYIVNIAGEYKANEVLLGGTIKGVTWAGTKNISFQMREKEGDISNVPAVGSIYSGCYVLKHDTYGSSVIVTLMSLDEKVDLDFEDNEDQASLEEAVKNGLEELSSGGVTMRLPSSDERKFVMENLSDINQKLTALGKTVVSSNTYTQLSDGTKRYNYDNGYYFRRASTGALSVYFFGDGKSTLGSVTIVRANAKGYRLRGFATVTF